VSQENVELVLDGYARFNAGERVSSLAWWHEDGEYVTSGKDPDADTHRGIDAVRRQYAGLVDAYPDLRVEPHEAKGNKDLVFVWVRFIGHGATSGLPIEMEMAHVITGRDGKGARVVEYDSREEALKVVGLEG
jgi:ketosteroid isomerase-like protein